MIVDHKFTPINTSLYGFFGNNIIPRGKITLAMEMGEPSEMPLNFKFLVVDNRSTYYRVLKRPTLNNLWVATSIYHICMKFLTEHEINHD